MTGYCVRCKGSREIANAYEGTTKTGRPVVRGNCSICNCMMNKFLAKHEELPTKPVVVVDVAKPETFWQKIIRTLGFARA